MRFGHIHFLFNKPPNSIADLNVPPQIPESVYKDVVEICGFPLISIDDIISVHEAVESGKLMETISIKGKRDAKS